VVGACRNRCSHEFITSNCASHYPPRAHSRLKQEAHIRSLFFSQLLLPNSTAHSPAKKLFLRTTHDTNQEIGEVAIWYSCLS
jgi:hypothetical protein